MALSSQEKASQKVLDITMFSKMAQIQKWPNSSAKQGMVLNS
jgi:hypothetical protein